MIKIYCDDILIDENYYMGLTKSGQLFTDSFKLGSTLCEEYKITLDKQGITAIPSVVKLYENDVLYKTLIVDDYLDEDIEITLYCMDYMINANISYDASPLMAETGSTTLKAILDDICEKIGVTNGVESFEGENLEVTWYNTDYSARNYLGFIAELNASYMYISPDNQLKMKRLKRDADYSIDFQMLEDYKIGHLHTITRVVWDDGNNKWELGDESGETYYIDAANVYVVSAEMVEVIYNLINGFSFYNFNTSNCPLENIEAGDLVTFYNGNVGYTTIAQFIDEIDYSGGYWNGGIELEVNNEMQQETQLLGPEERIKHLQTIVDRNNNTITTIVTQTEDIKQQVSNNTTDINNNYQQMLERFSGTASSEELEQLKTTMQTQIDANKYEISKIETAVIDGVEKVITSSGTFDENGLTMEQTNAQTKTILNKSGVSVQDVQGANAYDLLYAGYVDKEVSQRNDKKLEKYEGQTIVYSENMIVDNYMTIGTHSRIEDFEDGTGIFYLK